MLTETNYNLTERRFPCAIPVSHLYFEYVYSDLIAKLEFDVQSTHELDTSSRWKREFVNRVQSKCTKMDLPVEPTSGKIGKSMSLFRLRLKKFWDFDQVAHLSRQFTSVVSDALKDRM